MRALEDRHALPNPDAVLQHDIPSRVNALAGYYIYDRVHIAYRHVHFTSE